ncbi:MAG: prepilin-type N-terminal cleavage/methylation domain-containing protein [Synergistaceae bacterium]|nr:prepilin-type N-terminal cleavage/methylation domain-containing protein [Synergistaceae bacterium]
MLRKSGFTLIEIMIVLLIIGSLAGLMAPRISFFFEPPSASLQRAFEEACDMALSGTSVRFRVKKNASSERGTIEVEALMKREIPEDGLSSFLGTSETKQVLEWRKVDLRNIPTGEGWQFSPEVIYFYTDGSCTPAKISYAERQTSERNAENYILTVTGYCTKIQTQQ